MELHCVKKMWILLSEIQSLKKYNNNNINTNNVPNSQVSLPLQKYFIISSFFSLYGLSNHFRIYFINLKLILVSSSIDSYINNNYNKSQKCIFHFNINTKKKKRKKSAQFLNFWIEIQNRLKFNNIYEYFSECILE